MLVDAGADVNAHRGEDGNSGTKAETRHISGYAEALGADSTQM